MALPSNIRLNCAEPMKKKDFALMIISADLLMAVINLSPNKLIRPRRRNAMVFGTKDAVVMAEDANLDTKK